MMPGAPLKPGVGLSGMTMTPSEPQSRSLWAFGRRSAGVPSEPGFGLLGWSALALR